MCLEAEIPHPGDYKTTMIGDAPIIVIRDADGVVLATRVLAHPHVDEQPFTRGLSGVSIPHGLSQVTIVGHDSVHGHGGMEMTVDLPD